MRRFKVSQKAAMAARKVDPLPDPAFLGRVAERLTLDAGLSPEVARRRVQALAISAQPRDRNFGFGDRCR
jgi:hypothetical protein